MLQIKHIRKEYRTGKLVQKALDDVSLNLRDSEFVAILGPSGSGKTTLLNIIGGLDRYDTGDLIINGISTKKYRDKDWDSYRNHTIGFVFQSYNLIPHQTILSNVELALTISGIGRAERRQRAIEALEQVGLADQLHKKPNQMSGGQMQRVAIARALVNDPDILLADEPTGALDSDTSLQVMELLREVAKDRLVVMVTHNPELADAYATRIVKLRDGKIRSDSDPFIVDEAALKEPEHRNMGKASMSFLTALSLSFHNLKTKKARTLLTSFAGSIGIIGIALILALSTGVNRYIQTVEETTLSQYPLQIQSTGFDITSMLVPDDSADGSGTSGDVNVIQMVTNMFSKMDSNDLKSLKEYFDSGKSGIEPYINAIEYSYSAVPQIYSQNNGRIRQVNPDHSFDALGFGSSSSSSSLVSSMMSTDMFFEMPENAELYEDQYDVKAGRWPETYNECVLVLTSGGGISDFLLYTLGLRDALELDEMIQQFIDEKPVETPDNMGSYTYDDILGISFRLVSATDYYQYDSEYQVWTDKSDDEAYMQNLVENGEEITIVGIVQPSEDATASILTSGIGYPASLTTHVAERANQSQIVQDQLANPEINVFTGRAFGEESSQNEFDINSLFSVDTDALQNAFSFDESALSEGLDSSSLNLEDYINMEGGTADLSGLADLSSISLDLPEFSGLSLGDMMSSISITASQDTLSQMASGLLTGYQEYAAAHPEADYSGLLQSFSNYLNTEEAKNIFSETILEIIQSGGGISVSADQLRELIRSVMSGYQQYALEHGYTDPSRFDEYLAEYLQTPQAAQVLEQWASENLQIDTDITITPEQLQKLAGQIAAGYQQYAVSNGLPDPSRMGEHFMNYLNTEGTQKQLSDGIASMVDTGSLEAQISGALESYMQNAAASLGNAVSSAVESQMSSVISQLTAQISAGLQNAMTNAVAQIGQNMQNAMRIDTEAFLNAFQMKMNSSELSELLMSMSSGRNATYESNLATLGYVDFSEPDGIEIYPKDFESKEQAVAVLDAYNSRMEAEGKEDQVITYTDMVGTLMSSVTDIVDIVSYVLIAFVAISLVVSSIMIGVITYISVLERKKEIGILRAIGASKRNISQVFNAETFIIGLCAGLIGIGLSLLILIPGNALIHHLAGTNDVSAVLPAAPALILIALSVILTLIGGLIPSRKAAKSDPVAALRTE